MIAKKLTTILSLAAVVLALAACDSRAATPTPGDNTPISPAGTATIPANATMMPGALLTFTKTGGVAGFNTILTVQESGEYDLVGRGQQPKTGKLDGAKLNDLKQQLDAVRGLTGLKEEYDRGNVADDIYETVTFDQDGTPKTVTVAEIGGKDMAPEPLQKLIATINSIVETQ